MFFSRQFFFVDPLPQIIEKANTGSTEHYFTQYGANSLVNIQPTNMGPQVRLLENSTMDPEEVVHLPLSLPHSTTQTHVFSALKNSSLISVGQLFNDGCQAILNKKYL